MPTFFRNLLGVCCGIAIVFFVCIPTFSDELDDINKQIQDLTNALNMSVAATKPLESQLTSMQNQMTSIKNQIAGIDQDVAVKKKQIDNGYKDLEAKQQVLERTLRDFYIKSYSASPFMALFSSQNASQVTSNLVYQQAKADQDKTIITNIAVSISSLEARKAALTAEEAKLQTTKASLDAQAAKLASVINGAKAYQQTVSSQLATLSQRQNEILSARSGTFTASIGDSDLADDYNASIKGFREAAPSGSFGVFSFGAYTHRKGMSQYGAYGRAKNGQDYHAILKAYYGKDTSNGDTGGTIQVNGKGALDFETTYLYGIAEMPASFPTEALKAQAIAARSYAYRYKQQGTSICTDEGCQVYSSSKAATPPAEWKSAVDSTKGQIIDGVTTYFSSTTGGYLSTSGWDTTDGQGGSSFSDRAYEKLAGSPWFYKAWYTKSYSVNSDKCGRSNPWLSGSDMADIINGAMVLYHGGNGDEVGRVTPPSCWGGSPYSSDDLRSVSGKYGGGVSNVTGVTVSQGNGTTASVVFQTDKGSISISGENFKTAFNLRAPGYMSIPQNGFAFFNIEKK
jgi:peptidoglycan hydrolase-like amidase